MAFFHKKTNEGFKESAERVLHSMGVKKEAMPRAIKALDLDEANWQFGKAEYGRHQFFNFVLQDEELYEPKDCVLSDTIGPDGIHYRIADGIKEATPEDAFRVLQQRVPKIDKPGEPLPLRAADRLAGGYELKMVEGLDRRDIPEIIAFFNNCYREIPPEAFKEVGFQINEKKELTAFSGAKVEFTVHPYNTVGELLINIYYNGESLLVEL